MKKIRGTVDISMSFEEIIEVNALIERNIAKPMVGSEEETLAKCPTCGKYISKSDNFCGNCGQRIDNEAYAL